VTDQQPNPQIVATFTGETSAQRRKRLEAEAAKRPGEQVQTTKAKAYGPQGDEKK